MDLLHKMFADLMTARAGWDTRYRIVAVAVAALIAYVILRALHPIVRFLLLAILFLGIAYMVFPEKVCQLPWISTLQMACPR